MHDILILNGPNLGALGTRDHSLYGTSTLEELMRGLHERYPNVIMDHGQSDLEGELVQFLRSADGRYQGVVFNPGGYGHTSVALRDVISDISVPVVEVHITNLLAREPFRHTSLIGGVCAGSIMGFGQDGYRLAVEHLLHRVA